MKLKRYMQITATTIPVMAKKVGVSPRSIIHYRNGKSPNGNIIRRIVRATGGIVTAMDLL